MSTALLPRRLRGILGLALLALTILLTSAPVAAQSLDNKGKDFIVGFLPNFDASNTNALHLTADATTSVTVQYPVLAPTFTTTVTVNPGAITIVTLPIQTSIGWSNNSIQNNAVRAFSDKEFVAYMINRRPVSSDAALALPIDTMNTEYIVMDYNPRFRGSEFVVVAGFDGTQVKITPSTNMVGRTAGVPFTVTLNRGQGYFARGASLAAANTLTGTLIEASRPVGVTNGNGCPQVPNGTVFCDHIFEVAQPVQSWGNSFAVANLPQRLNGSIYRVLASQDATTVKRNGTTIAVLNRGKFFETSQIAGNHVFTADKPIYVAQFMTGDGAPGSTQGDPAMGNMIPTAQYLNDYTFSTVGGGQFATHYVSIIAANSDIGSLKLDGAIVPTASFFAIGTSGFSAAIIKILQGTHTTSSTNGHGITVEGYNNVDSYIYPGGALFKFINPVGDEYPPLCSEVSSTATTLNGVAVDNRPSEDTNGNGVLDPGEDTNNNGKIDKDTGIFFVSLQPGAVNLSLSVNAFVPGDPSVRFTVSTVNANAKGEGTVRATDGAGNTCDLVVELGLQVDPNASTVEVDSTLVSNCESTTVHVTPKLADGTLMDPGQTVVLSVSPAGAATLGALTYEAGTYSADLTPSATATSATVSATVNGIALTQTQTVNFVNINPNALDVITTDVAETFVGGIVRVTVKPINCQGQLAGSGLTVVLTSSLGTFTGPVTDLGNGCYETKLKVCSPGAALIQATVNELLLNSSVSLPVNDTSNLGRVIGVDSLGSTHSYCSVQQAIKKVVKDGLVRILISPGNYDEHIKVEKANASLVIEGLSACTPTVLKGAEIDETDNVALKYLTFDGSDSGDRVVEAEKSLNTQVICCTIKSGKDKAKGVEVEDGATMTIVDSYITSNGGDGIFVDEKSGLTMTKTLVEGNGFNGVSIKQSGTASISGSTIRNNGTAGKEKAGYGVYRKRSKKNLPTEVTLIQNTITGNRGKVVTNESTADIANYDQIIDPGDNQSL